MRSRYVPDRMFGRTRRGYVYFARQPRGHYIKIGFSTDVDQRGLGTWFCEVLAYIGPVGQEVEVALHKRFSHLRVHREWFEPAEDLLVFIDALAGKAVQE